MAEPAVKARVVGVSDWFEFILNVIFELLDVFTGAGKAEPEDTNANRTIWLAVILIAIGFIWWQLH